MIIRPASLIAFTRDALAALPVFENRRLRAANRDLWMENVSLSAVASDLAEQLATSRRALAHAVNHPSVRASDFDFGDDEPDEIPTAATLYVPPAERGDYIDAVAVLDRDDLVLGDVIHEGGWIA